MDTVIVVICLILIWFGGYVLGTPDADEIFVGSKSGYICAEVKPATEAGEKAVCLIYTLEVSHEP